jgi:hypothetical protein
MEKSDIFLDFEGKEYRECYFTEKPCTSEIDFYVGVGVGERIIRESDGKIFLVRGVGGFINGTYKIEIEEYKGTDEELQEILHDYREKHECKVPAHDAVEHPVHYETGKFECIDVMLETQGVEAVKDFCVCNAFKYLYRHWRKNGAEDIKKAIWYLKKWVELDDNGRAEKAVK